MTLAEALATLAAEFDAIAEQQIAAFELDLIDGGATPEECLAVRALQYARLAPSRRRVLELTRVVWWTWPWGSLN